MCEVNINPIFEFEELNKKKQNEKKKIKLIKWNDYLNEYKNTNPNLKYKEMLKECSINYRKLKALIL